MSSPASPAAWPIPGWTSTTMARRMLTRKPRPVPTGTPDMHLRRARLRIGLALLLLVLAANGRAAAPVQESWDAVAIAGAKVGSVHAVVEPVKDRGRDRLRVRVEMALTFKRLDATVTVRMG